MNDREIKLTPVQQTFRNVLSARNPQDTYRFSFAAPENLVMRLRRGRASTDATLAVFNPRGKRLVSFESEELSRRRTLTLEAGTYRLQVSQSKGNMAYRLQLAAQPRQDWVDDSLATAQWMRSTTKAKTYEDFVSPRSDAIDYYRFQINSDTIANLSVKGQFANVRVQLLGADGQAIGQIHSPAANQVLNPGLYYLRVKPTRRATSYSIRLSSSEYFDLAGNTLNTGRSVTLSSDNKTYTDFVGQLTDSSDYYQFQLTDRSTQFGLSFGNTQADLRVQLLNDQHQPVALFNDKLGDRQTAVLAAGTYFVHVQSRSRRLTRYSLKLSGTAIADPWVDDRPEFAYSLPYNFSGTVTGFVGTGDPADYFRIPIVDRLNLAPSFPQATPVIAGQPVKLQYDLITDTGTRIPLSGEVGVILPPGTYFLRIAAVQGDAYYRLGIVWLYPPPQLITS
ncbi:MAG: hypothetical protein Kow00121_17160 [Elainellaceae cyanobacterium]